MKHVMNLLTVYREVSTDFKHQLNQHLIAISDSLFLISKEKLKTQRQTDSDDLENENSESGSYDEEEKMFETKSLSLLERMKTV